MLALSLLVPALLATAELAAPRPDPCAGAEALADQGCEGQPLCSRRERVELACAVRDALEKRYVFYAVKRRLLGGPGQEGLDARRHLDACVAAERAREREDDPLRFYDRVRRCTASFEDGHLAVGAPVRLPEVALGIGLRLVEGKVRVANREKRLVSLLQAMSSVPDDLLAVGAEVAEIDGRPALERVRELARYVPGSSEAARLERAVDALTRRDFAYPERRSAAFTFVVNGARRSVELPWWISPEAQGNVMAGAYLRRTGLATTDLLAWRRDPARDAWDRDPAATQGYSRTAPIVDARDAAALREYVDGRDRPALRLGEVVRRRDRAFCYLQILTFHAEALGSPAGREPFSAVVEGFVRRCKEKDLDLVLDLRHNEGGYLAHTSTLLAALGERGKEYPGGALLLRANTLNQLVYAQRSPAVGAGPRRAADDALEPRHIAEAIGAAKRAGAEFTPAFLERPVRASGAVGGYSGRVVALIAPTCMSACDRLAALLRASARAVLVGGPTEGAGGSQQEAKDLGARWSDPEGLLSVFIPNAAMGVQRALPSRGAWLGESPPDEFFRALALENRPVQPDVPYATRLEDLTGSNRGWLAQVDAVLFGGAGAPATRGEAVAGR